MKNFTDFSKQIFKALVEYGVINDQSIQSVPELKAEDFLNKGSMLAIVTLDTKTTQKLIMLASPTDFQLARAIKPLPSYLDEIHHLRKEFMATTEKESFESFMRKAEQSDHHISKDIDGKDQLLN